MPNYPSADPSFATKNTGDTIQGSHVNSLQDEVVAIGSALRGSLQHDLTTASGKNFSLGGVATGAAQPRARAYNNAGVQSINDSVLTALTFDSEDYDVGLLHSTSANTSRMTIPAGGDGLYLIVGKAIFAANGTGTVRLLRITKNGAVVGTQNFVTPSASIPLVSQVVGIEALVAGDYIEIAAQQDSGGALNIGAATGGANRPNQNELSLVKLW